MRSGLIALVAAAATVAASFTAGAAAGKTLQAYRHILLDGHKVKWGLPQPGTGAVVTYATLDGPQKFPLARNCQAMGPVAPLLAANRIPAERLRTELRAAFALWSTVANIRFEPAAAPDSADIVIGTQAVPRGRAFTNVEYGGPEPGAKGIRPLTRSLICLNPEIAWKTQFDGNLEVYDLRYTLLHEIGHAIGLDHPAVASQLMDFRYLEQFRSPQPGDISGVVALYGPSRVATAAAKPPAVALRQVSGGPPVKRPTERPGG